MTPSRRYLLQHCQVKLSRDMHIHSETKNTFCGQYHVLMALNRITKEKMQEKQTINHALKALNQTAGMLSLLP